MYIYICFIIRLSRSTWWKNCEIYINKLFNVTRILLCPNRMDLKNIKVINKMLFTFLPKDTGCLDRGLHLVETDPTSPHTCNLSWLFNHMVLRWTRGGLVRKPFCLGTHLDPEVLQVSICSRSKPIIMQRRNLWEKVPAAYLSYIWGHSNPKYIVGQLKLVSSDSFRWDKFNEPWNISKFLREVPQPWCGGCGGHYQSTSAYAYTY